MDTFAFTSLYCTGRAGNIDEVKLLVSIPHLGRDLDAGRFNGLEAAKMGAALFIDYARKVGAK